jgi:WD40 repeat protein
VGGREAVRIWDPGTGEPLHELSGHADEVRSLAFSPDGRTLASGDGKGTIHLWAAA